jgi:hypothetical protein
MYEARNVTEYPHQNPMIRPNNQGLLDGDTDKEFFDKTQFPIEYTFAQNAQGLVSRNFRAGFHVSKSVTSKKFFLVNPSTSKALSILNCERLVVEDHDKEQTSQQFQLNENDEIVSPSCSSKVITADEKCLHGNVLLLYNTQLNSNTQKWRFYEDGIVNLQCGRRNENLAITSIPDNSFHDIPYIDDIEFYISNAFNELSISVGDAVSHLTLIFCCAPWKLKLFLFTTILNSLVNVSLARLNFKLQWTFALPRLLGQILLLLMT